MKWLNVMAPDLFIHIPHAVCYTTIPCCYKGEGERVGIDMRGTGVQYKLSTGIYWCILKWTIPSKVVTEAKDTLGDMSYSV